MTPQNYTNLQKKARAKYISSALVSPLYRLTDSPLHYSYKSAYYCAHTIDVNSEGKTTAKYCGQRFCIVCSRIRMAENINSYQEQISNFQSPVFLTLTVPNIKVYGSTVFCSGRLISEYETIFAELEKIRNLGKKKGYELKGIVKFEVTINMLYGELHPHLHLLLSSKVTAKWILQEWLKRFPEASDKSQNIQEIAENSLSEFDKLNHLKEVFKYVSKSVYEIKVGNETKKVNPYLYLDYIYTELKGLRLSRAWGLKKQIVEETPEQLISQFEAMNRSFGVYRWAGSDWFHSGVKMQDYVLQEATKEDKRLQELAKNMDVIAYAEAMKQGKVKGLKSEDKTKQIDLNAATGEALAEYTPTPEQEELNKELKRGYDHRNMTVKIRVQASCQGTTKKGIKKLKNN